MSRQQKERGNKSKKRQDESQHEDMLSSLIGGELEEDEESDIEISVDSSQKTPAKKKKNITDQEQTPKQKKKASKELPSKKDEKERRRKKKEDKSIIEKGVAEIEESQQSVKKTAEEKKKSKTLLKKRKKGPSEEQDEEKIKKNEAKRQRLDKQEYSDAALMMRPHRNIPAAPFKRLVKEIVQEVAASPDLRMTTEAVDTLQLAAESEITNVLWIANIFANITKRSTVSAKDVKFGALIRQIGTSGKNCSGLHMHTNYRGLTDLLKEYGVVVPEQTVPDKLNKAKVLENTPTGYTVPHAGSYIPTFQVKPQKNEPKKKKKNKKKEASSVSS